MSLRLLYNFKIGVKRKGIKNLNLRNEYNKIWYDIRKKVAIVLLVLKRVQDLREIPWNIFKEKGQFSTLDSRKSWEDFRFKKEEEEKVTLKAL